MTPAPPTARHVLRDLHALATPAKAASSARFFKSEKGQYGYGDKLLGVTVPEQRAVAKRYAQQIILAQVEELLRSPWHEARLTGLLILVYRYQRADTDARRAIYQLYLRLRERVNNWDLVDSSAPHIVGAYMLEHPVEKKKLYVWAGSIDLWERRIAVLATQAFIRVGEYGETLRLAEMLLHDEHDLMHKAVGWMLREVGKKDERVLRRFLDAHASTMPRTMLRYAIERLPEAMRSRYMKA